MDCEIEGINDSKKLSEKKRDMLFDIIKEKALAYSVVMVDAKTIDEIESLTRIDFFSLLPDDIENKVESSYSTSTWGFY